MSTTPEETPVEPSGESPYPPDEQVVQDDEALS